MKTTVNLSMFRDAFSSSSHYKYNFSYTGLSYLFGFLEDLEKDTGEELELDVIALCCDYAEASVDELIDDYSIPVPDEADDKEKLEIVLDFINEYSFIVGTYDNQIIYVKF